jgi:hypothetical protein
MINFQDLFHFGMKRELNPLLAYNGITLDIGSSLGDRWTNPDARSLGPPDWNFPRDNIPYEEASVSTIHCYHFLEHLTGADAISFLRECERVMIPGASVMNFCVPYYKSNLAAECLDHKSQWTEETFRNLFDNSGYDIAGCWDLRLHFQLIAGVVERNLCIIGQLIR